MATSRAVQASVMRSELVGPTVRLAWPPIGKVASGMSGLGVTIASLCRAPPFPRCPFSVAAGAGDGDD